MGDHFKYADVALYNVLLGTIILYGGYHHNLLVVLPYIGLPIIGQIIC